MSSCYEMTDRRRDTDTNELGDQEEKVHEQGMGLYVLVGQSVNEPRTPI
jgi:hypothetical protein